MASRSLGTLTLDLVAKIGGFTQGMDQASRVADKRMREIERRANAFGNAIGKSIKAAAVQFLAFTGVAVSIGAAFESIKNAIDLADETRDLSIQLGISTQAVSDFRYAAQQTGTDMDALAKGMKILAKNAAAAGNPTSAQAKIFTALGISVTDSTGRLKDLADLVPEIADKFKGLEDGTTKAALAQSLFGKSGLELTEFLNSGSQGLADYGDKLRKLGGEITPEAAEAADRFNDHLNDLKTAFGGAALQVASKLLPAMDDLIVDLQKFTASNAADTANDIASGFEKMGQAVDSLSQVVDFLQQIHSLLASSDALAKSFGNFTGVSKFGDAMRKAMPWLYASPGKAQGPASSFAAPSNLQIPVLNGGSGFNATAAQFSAVPSYTPTKPTDARALALALSNPSAPKGAKKGGKSDAEREAEQVKRAIEQMTQAQKDWEAEVSKTGNLIADEYADRLRDIAEQGAEFSKEGVPTEKVKAFTDEMTRLAQTLRDSDIAKFQKEFDDETAAMAAQMQGPAAEALQRYREDVDHLSEQLAKGAITIEEYNARLAVLGQLRDDPMAQVNAAIQEQIDLLGMSIEQQEVYNNLKAAGVGAESDWGQVIAASTAELQKQRDILETQIDIMDGLRESTHTFLDDLQKGEGVWHSLKDAASEFLDVLIEIGERQLIEQLFGKQGTVGSGSTGGSGWLGALLGMFSGGGGFGGEGSPLASGGMVLGPGTGTSDSVPIRASNGEFVVRAAAVRQYGPDLLHAINQGRYPAFAGGGMVGTAPHAAPAGSRVVQPVTIQFIQRDRFTKETGTQAGKRAATELQMARARNG